MKMIGAIRERPYGRFAGGCLHTIAHVGCTDTTYHENGRGGLPGHVAQGMTGKRMNMRLQSFSLLYLGHFGPFWAIS